MNVAMRWQRPLVLGLAAATLCVGAAFAQRMPLDERIQICGSCHGEPVSPSRTVTAESRNPAASTLGPPTSRVARDSSTR